MTATVDLTRWTPIRVSLDAGEPGVEWCYTGETRFDDPFFDQTIERCLRRPFPLLFRQTTPLSETARLVADSAPSEPAGFIFHASRCGSTLLSQMLAALPGVHVLSEASPVDTVLRARVASPGTSTDQLVSWVRTIVLALCRPGSTSVFKLDSWSTVELPVLRQAFPDVPWVFLYREPREIISSQLRRRGAHMIPGVLPAELFGLDAEEAVNLPAEDYCARVVAAICSAALDAREQDPERSLFVNYRTLPAVMPDAIAALFGVECGERERQVVLDVATRDAKNPVLLYDAGNAPRPSPAVAHAAARWAEPVYRRLEGIR